jgi:hypothetical protein
MQKIKINSRLVTTTEVELIIKNILTKKTAGSDNFTGKFYQTHGRNNTNLTQIVAKERRSKSQLFL